MKQKFTYFAILLISVYAVKATTSEFHNVIGSKFMRDKKEQGANWFNTGQLEKSVTLHKFPNNNMVSLGPKAELLDSMISFRKSSFREEGSEFNSLGNPEKKTTSGSGLESKDSLNKEAKPNSIIPANNNDNEKDHNLVSNSDKIQVNKRTLKINNKVALSSSTNNKANAEAELEAGKTQNKKTKTAYGGFFDSLNKNSKDNENMAWKALGTFLGGIACFFISIHLTCWNERRAVKEAEFTDYISREDRCIVVGNGVKLTEIDSSKSYLISGSLSLKEPAKIPDLNIEFKEGGGRILGISYVVEKFSTWTETERADVERNGEEYEQTTVTKHKTWNRFDGADEKLKNRLFSGVGFINDTYKVDLNKLSHLIESHQTQYAADNRYTVIFGPQEESLLLEYLKKDSSTEVKVFAAEEYLYVIRSNADKVTKENFNCKNYNFSESDLRIRIKYVRDLLFFN